LRNNAWIWSEKDVNEDSLTDPWLVFKPLNFWEDKSNRGELIDLRSIESNQFLGRYEDQMQLFNQVSNVADAINNQNKELGTGFLYNRPISFKKADLGFAGTQNTDFVSTPYGHLLRVYVVYLLLYLDNFLYLLKFLVDESLNTLYY